MAMAASETAIVLSTAFALLCTIYVAVSPFFPKPKQAAWILSTVASGTMTASSLPFVKDYLEGGLANVDERVRFAAAINRVFQAYLAADLVVGAFFYRSQINLLTGWVHHLVYIGICEFAIGAGWGYIFGLSAVMELPTFVLGLGTLFPHLRSDNLFALTFFATRISFHVVLIFTYFLAANRPQGSLAPALILTSVFPLHAMWFLGCIKGFIRRSNQRKATTAKHPLTPDVHLDSRSLARHTTTAPIVPPWDVTLRLRRLRARVGRWVWTGAPVTWVRDAGVGRWVSVRRPIRPRAMARRMSQGLVNALPSKEAMMDFVGWGS
ncbi:hypothetical protein MIND_01315300 [Mycena indigotica]|uniref:TLC domain-containing protein n=1 Tax=Mycena indigotica TaxID=2126181 RepID=A0A8H6VSW4_9AGAR|nr:uncharacterized protein MIND_01315300 [Mycena indigotica]KAF7290746.1 hypothetical protein MIND_01315300 [Mycena indigotica]